MTSLESVRAGIDEIDSSLASLLAKRFGLVDFVAAAKTERGIPVNDPARESAILERAGSIAGADSADDVKAVFEAIFAVSRARQERIVK